MLNFNGKNFSSLHNLSAKEKGELAKVVNSEVASFYGANTLPAQSIFDFLQCLYDTLINSTIEYYDYDLEIVELCLDNETSLKVCDIVLRSYIKNC